MPGTARCRGARRRDHRIRLQRPGTLFPGEPGRGSGQCAGDPALAVPLGVTKQVTAQTLSSALSSRRPDHTVLVRSSRG